MPAIASNVIVDSDAFRANRTAHLELIAEFRALERKVCEASSRADDKFRAARAVAAARADQLAARPRLALSRALEPLRARHARGRRRRQRLWRRADRRHRLVSGARCLVVGERFRDQGRRRASDGGREGDPRAGDRASRASFLTSSSSRAQAPIFCLQAEMFVRGGATFANMARLSAAGIPVISIVHGSSTAGGAYQTGLADYVVMVRGRSKVFLAGPPLLKAATGEIAGDEALGGAELHCVDDRPRRISRRRRRRRPAHRSGDPRPSRLGRAASARLRPGAALRSRGTARNRAGRLPQALRRSRGDRAARRRLGFSRFQAGLRPGDFMRPRRDRRPSGRAHRQQRSDRFRGIKQSRAVHPTLLSGGPADRLPAEHHRLSRRRRAPRPPASSSTARR